jgi:uncharacterized protein YktA (UPF0223 family)
LTGPYKEVQQLIQQVKQQPRYSIANLIKDGHEGAVTATIKKVAKLYGNMEDLDHETGKECLRQLANSFKNISIGEIMEAYRIWAAGDLGEIYANNFSPKQFTAILSAYVKEIRRKTLADYYKDIDQIEKAKQREKAKAAQAEYEKTFPAMIEAQKGQPWQEMKSHWYDTAIRLNIITEPTTAEKWQYMDKAKAEHRKEQQDKPVFIEGTFKAMALKEFERTVQDSRIKTIAKLMILADRI